MQANLLSAVVLLY